MSEVVYKALSRPPTLFGCPMFPLMIVVGLTILLSLYVSLAFFPIGIAAIMVMKAIVKHDDFAFTILSFKFKFLQSPIVKSFYGTNGYNTQGFECDKLQKFGYPKLTPLNGLHQIPSIDKYIPYQTLLNENIVITKNFEFLATWQIGGVPFEVENENFISMNKNRLNTFLKQFADQSVSFYFHNARVGISDGFKAKFPNEFLQNINDEYYKNFDKDNLKENKMFITAIYSPLSLADISLLKRGNLKQKTQQISQVVEKFQLICNSIQSSLEPFAPHRLEVYEKNGIKFSSQLEFYDYLICGEFHPVRVANAPLFSYLNGNLDEILYTQHTIQFKNSQKSKFAKIIEIKDYPSETFSGIFDVLMYRNAEYTITQSFTPINRKKALTDIRLQEQRLLNTGDDAFSQIADLAVARDELQSGNIIFGQYHFTITVYGNDKDDITAKTNAIISDLNDLGFLTSTASLALMPSYFAQFPSNFGLRVRIHTLSSANLASLVAFHNFPCGRRDENQWGEAVTILKTPNKQPYYFNFHKTRYGRNDFGETLLGNTLVLGQSGSGKTVLMNFLLCQLTKYSDPQSFPNNTRDDKRKFIAFYLDKDKAAIGNVIASGGKYITIDAGKPTGFNPFMVEATAENRRRLKVLVKMLVTRTGKILTTLEEESLNQAVDSVLDMFEDPKERTHGITLLCQRLSEKDDDTNSVLSILRAWCIGNEFGWVFDNATDELNFDDDCLIYGIDGTDLLKDEEINGFVAYYILWRIVDLIDGRRFALFIDEAWDWLQNPIVAKEIFNKEKTIRKQNGFLCLGTQSVDDLAGSSIATALIEQSENILLLANPQGNKEDYVDNLSMSQEEFDFVKTTDPDAYKFMIKKGKNERTVASMDFSRIGKTNLKILSTASEFVEPIEEINKNPNLSYQERLTALEELYGGKK